MTCARRPNTHTHIRSDAISMLLVAALNQFYMAFQRCVHDFLRFVLLFRHCAIDLIIELERGRELAGSMCMDVMLLLLALLLLLMLLLLVMMAMCLYARMNTYMCSHRGEYRHFHVWFLHTCNAQLVKGTSSPKQPHTRTIPRVCAYGWVRVARSNNAILAASTQT